LPERPDLEQLRRRAKELRDAFGHNDPAATALVAEHIRSIGRRELSLAVAQLVIAREHGFPSWPSLKAAVDAARRSGEVRLAAFLGASLSDLSRSQQLIEVTPAIAAERLAAAVMGDAARVARILAADPGWVARPDEERGWAPLLYACYSLWHRTRADGSVVTVRLLPA
jgi:hypothetical protein